ncbi:M56 family metallopeptidase [Pedobacter cryoconitis]|uniref:Beta-lactamase regulating signal transducer with metallopeptidase domain n=1 Tax=Pedobacter cryoconitis TaxID=188932 RepID=A0A327S0L3_9SPHI|nr:M56 family metallopeptidase [Pedobacter cryoconitis]RAJ22646.1 beta-lactamase regulating signal transducer with metallopeptidase domain [Pedobacter cryoconitis]
MEALVNNLIQATGWSILHSLWQAALVYALLLPTQMRIFRLKARLKYNLAFAANAFIFICFLITFFSIFKWPADQQQAMTAQVMVNNPLSYSFLSATLIPYAEKLFPFLVLLYSIGLVIQSVIVFKGYHKIQSLKRADRISIPAEWTVLFEALTKKLNISKHVSFHLSEHVNVPLVIGFFKPVVLFPVALMAQMEMKHIEAILIHELSHIRRNDYLFNLIRTLIETILFFNPFVWLTGKFIDIEREHACDDLVVGLTNTPLTYAHALLQLELLADKSSPVFALAATGKNQHLYQRIKRITAMKTNYMNSKQKLFAVALTLTTIISLAWINPAKRDQQLKQSKVSKDNATLLSPSVQLPIDTGKKKTKRVYVFKSNDTPDSMVIQGPDSLPLRHVYINHNRPEPPAVIMPPAPPAPPVPLNIETDSLLGPDFPVTMINFSSDVKDMVAASFSGNERKIESLAARIEEKGKALERQFNSPAEKAKWAKFDAEIKAKYDNPAARAKWEKMAREMQAKYNSPEQKAAMKKLQQQARLQALSAQQMINSPEFKARIKLMSADNSTRMVILNESEEQQKLKKTAEYQELKKKFDKDVEKLKAKDQKKDTN